MCNTCGCKGAEGFEADTPDPINPEYIEDAIQNLPKEQYLEFCDYFEIDPNDEKELSQFLQKNRNDSNVLMKLDVLNLDAWYDSRYRLPQASFFGVDAEGFEADHPKHSMRGKVRTMSGKPHSPRKLVKDKDISPKEAAKRMKLEAQMMEQPEETFYDEGRMLARAVFMPDMRDRDSFGLMDTEYMIHFGISPDELINEMESGSKRYNQFSWGWGQEWDKLSSEYALNPDGDMNESYQDEEFYDQSGNYFEGEWVGRHPFQEYIPDTKEVAAWEFSEQL